MKLNAMCEWWGDLLTSPRFERIMDKVWFVATLGVLVIVVEAIYAWLVVRKDWH